MYQKPDLSNPILEKARVFARAVHTTMNQTRYSEDGDEPLEYLVHPLDVAAKLQSLPNSSGITIEMLASAILHDVVEDSRKFIDGKLIEGITEKLIEEEFGPEVRRLVSGLTDVSMPWDGNRKIRKAMDLAHTAEQKADVHTIKLADLISNAWSIIKYNQGFARKWMAEKGAMLEVLGDGDPILYEEATTIYRNYIGRNHV